MGDEVVRSGREFIVRGCGEKRKGIGKDFEAVLFGCEWGVGESDLVEWRCGEGFDKRKG